MPAQSSLSKSPRSTSPSLAEYDEDLQPPQLPQFAVSEEIGLSLNSQLESQQLQRALSTRKAQQLQRQSRQVLISQNTTTGPSVPRITVDTDSAITTAEAQEEWSLPSSKPASSKRSQKDDQSISTLPQDSSVEIAYTSRTKKRWATYYDTSSFPVENFLQPPISETKIARSPSTRPTTKDPPSSVPVTSKSHTLEEKEVEICHDSRSSISEDDRPIYDVTRPTCSLMLVCYRSGPRACESKQIEVISRSRFDNTSSFKQLLNLKPELIRTDRQFFQALRRVYRKEMCSIWRRLFFLKTLRSIRLLSYSTGVRPKAVPLDDVALQEIFYAYNNPSKVEDSEYETPWIKWVYRLRKPEQRHALEFVESWDGKRIIIAGTLPWFFSTIVGVAWSVKSGDVQTAFTVAGFILTSGTVILAVLAVINGIETSGQAVTEHVVTREVFKRME